MNHPQLALTILVLAASIPSLVMLDDWIQTQRHRRRRRKVQGPAFARTRGAR